MTKAKGKSETNPVSRRAEPKVRRGARGPAKANNKGSRETRSGVTKPGGADIENPT